MTIQPDTIALAVEDLGKSFTLHMHGGTRLPVVSQVGFEVHAGECVVLGGRRARANPRS